MIEPEYYSKNGLSPLKAFEKGLLSKEQYVGFCKGNVIKYTVRAGEKTSDASSDIKKAIHYLNVLDDALSDDWNFDDVDVDISEFRDNFNIKIDELKESISEFKNNL